MSLLGCSDPEGPGAGGGFVPYDGGRADAAGEIVLVHCQIAHEGEGFFASNTMTCSAGDDLPTTNPIVVVDRADQHYDEIVLEGGTGTLSFYDDAYPLSVSVRADTVEMFGLPPTRFVTEPAVVESAADLSEPQAIVLPFQTWTVTVESRTNIGRLDFDDYALTLQGAHFERLSANTGDSTTIQGTVSLFAGDVQTIRLATSLDQDALRGTAAYEGGEQPFEITGSGGYVLSGDGLVPSDDVVAPTDDGVDVARCEPGFIEGGLGFTCHVVARPGVTVGAATVTVDGAAMELPLDGSEMVVPAPGTEAVTLALSVEISGGIDGLPWENLPAIESEQVIERSGPQAMALSLPFDLLHVHYVVSDDVMMAFFDASEEQTLRFTRSWNDSFEATITPSADINAEDPDIWLAVNAGTTSVAGTLTVLNQGGAQNSIPLSLEAGDYLLDVNGVQLLEPPASGTELLRCWFEPSGSLACDRNAEAAILDATVFALLEPYSNTLDFDVGVGHHNITTFQESFLPVVMTLSVNIPGQAAPLTAERRVEAFSDLPESDPLVVIAP